MQSGVYRILDVATNRGREAIRVIEDAIRFVCDDSVITSKLKTLRHEFASLTGCFPPELRMNARATQDDVGTTITADGEYLRSSMNEVVTANFARLEESLRSIEEFSKMVFPDVSPGVEQLRYYTYTLERQVFERFKRLDEQNQRHSRLERLENACVYALLDTSVSDGRFLQYVEAGVDIIQLRDKAATDRAIVLAGQRWKAILDSSCSLGTPPLLIMNDRADLALCAGFDGVHVGQDELYVEDVRRMVGPDMLIGVSTHDMNEVRAAIAAKADYLGLGPVFPTETKHCDRFPGTVFLQEFARAGEPIPAFAIGGIDATRAADIASTGIRRVAVCSYLTKADDVSVCVGLLKSIMKPEPELLDEPGPEETKTAQESQNAICREES
ncbi:MAG: thiamine phosphate synthase, partial [Thermoguttaceae bacterium]|nr:thiamine phosphate synthase [Thermoguttaceae bacterium]